MKKNKIGKSLIVIYLLAFVFILGQKVVFASIPSINIVLSVTNNGMPANNTKIVAICVSTLFQKLENGDFTNQEVSSLNWQKMKIALQPNDMGSLQNDSQLSEEPIISLPNGLNFGPNVRHNQFDAKVILEYILKNGDLNFLKALNGNQPVITFLNPTDPTQGFTNVNGEGQAIIPSGMYAIFSRNPMTSNDTFFKIVSFDEQSKINLDLKNLSDDVSFSLKENHDCQPVGYNQYVVASGSQNVLNYKLILKKRILSQQRIFMLNSSPNLVLTRVSFTSEEQMGSISSPPSINNETPNIIGLGNQIIKINPSSTDVEINIQAYVNPTATNAINTSASYLTLNEIDNTNDQLSAVSPVVNLSGINFVMSNKSHKALAIGDEFILGKKDDHRYYYFNKVGQWIETNQENFKALDLSQVMTIKGGKQYQFGNPAALDIPLISNRWSLSTEEARKNNQSLIQLNGFALGNDYFLYRVKSEEMDANIKIPFSISTKFKRLNNQSIVMSNSISDAKYQNFNINQLIPDFSTNSMEYNDISLGETNFSSNSWIVIASVCIAIIFVLLISGILMIKIK